MLSKIIPNLAKKTMAPMTKQSMKMGGLAKGPKFGGMMQRRMSSVGIGTRQSLLTQRAKENRHDLANWFAMVKTGQQMWHDNTNLATEYENLMPPTKLVRHDTNPTSPDAQHIEDQTTKKAHLDVDSGKLHPSGNGVHGDSSDPYGTKSAQESMDHIRGKQKNDSPLISSTLADEDSITDLSSFGDKIEIDSSKAKVKPTKLTVAELLFNTVDDDVVKSWDWRQDKLLKLDQGGKVEDMEELMADYGIDPNKKKFTRTEKMAVFALATNENLIVGSTGKDAAKIQKDEID